MGLLEDFERSHTRQFIEVEAIPLPKRTLRTSDGADWSIQRIVRGHRERISDRWAWINLHCWIVERLLEVQEVKLPCPLVQHSPSSEAWSYIEREYGPGEREEPQPFVGRSDFCGEGRLDGRGGHRALYVEFGNCAPAKFALNVAYAGCDHMIVPYHSPYAFVFLPTPRLSQEVLARSNTRVTLPQAQA